MEYQNKQKILITGPRSTGSTFLVGLLHRLGLNTGFEDDEVTRIFQERGKGLEYIRLGDTRELWLGSLEQNEDISPHVIKHPIRVYGDLEGAPPEDILDISDEAGWDIEHMFITIRKLNSMTESVQRRTVIYEPLVFKETSTRQFEWIQAEGLYRLMHRLSTRNFPFTLVEFPRSIFDADYCYRRLRPILGLMQRDEFRRVHKETAHIDMVHVK